MSASATTCAGCAQCQRRFRSTGPHLWCQRFHQPAVVRCEDYRTRRTAIATALDYLKRSSIK